MQVVENKSVFEEYACFSFIKIIWRQSFVAFFEKLTKPVKSFLTGFVLV